MKIFNSIPIKLLIIFGILLVVYLGLIEIWRATSPNYQPEGSLDHVVRQSPPVDEWLQTRRDHS